MYFTRKCELILPPPPLFFPHWTPVQAQRGGCVLRHPNEKAWSLCLGSESPDWGSAGAAGTGLFARQCGQSKNEACRRECTAHPPRIISLAVSCCEQSQRIGWEKNTNDADRLGERVDSAGNSAHLLIQPGFIKHSLHVNAAAKADALRNPEVERPGDQVGTRARSTEPLTQQIPCWTPAWAKERGGHSPWTAE